RGRVLKDVQPRPRRVRAERNRKRPARRRSRAWNARARPRPTNLRHARPNPSLVLRRLLGHPKRLLGLPNRRRAQVNRPPETILRHPTLLQLPPQQNIHRRISSRRTPRLLFGPKPRRLHLPRRVTVGLAKLSPIPGAVTPTFIIRRAMNNPLGRIRQPHHRRIRPLPRLTPGTQRSRRIRRALPDRFISALYARRP